MFSKRMKFSQGAVKRNLRFAFLPNYIDGGVKKIWLSFYFRLYVREVGYLNWNKPDEFRCVGDYSFKGSQLKLDSLKSVDESTHWAKEDKNLFPNFLQAKS